MIKTIPLLPLSDDDAVLIASNLAIPDWLKAKAPLFKMRDDELYAVWEGGSAVWTGEDWVKR